MSVCCVVFVVARNVPGRECRWKGVSVMGSVVWVLATMAVLHSLGESSSLPLAWLLQVGRERQLRHLQQRPAKFPQG